jgi:hypothetical protein
MNPMPPEQGYGDAPPPRKKNVALIVVLSVLGVCGCGGVALFAAILFPVFAQAKEAAKTTGCMSNVKQQAGGMLMYSIDFDDRLPLGDTWMDDIKQYTKSDAVYHCPSLGASGAGVYGYAFQDKLRGKNLAKIEEADMAIMVFDSRETGRNAVAGLNTLPIPGRHFRRGKGNVAGMADGAARFMPSGSPGN